MLNRTISTTNNRFDSGQGYSYDSSGNTTADAEGRTFVYNAENKQVEVIQSSTTIGEYFYDGDGKRVKKIAGSEETLFVYDAGGRLIGEYSTIVQTGSNAKTVYTTNDHLGSPRINTDGTGQVISRHDYHPFGEEVDRTSFSYGSGRLTKENHPVSRSGCHPSFVRRGVATEGSLVFGPLVFQPACYGDQCRWFRLAMVFRPWFVR